MYHAFLMIDRRSTLMLKQLENDEDYYEDGDDQEY